jgi:hypothetical protein
MRTLIFAVALTAVALPQAPVDVIVSRRGSD